MVDKPAGSQARRACAPLRDERGPSNTSSFHVVGTIFDRVWIDGNPDNQFRGMQTVLLGSSNGAIVEFMIPEAGSYVMVDHHFANASQGAVGLIATGKADAGTPSTTTSRVGHSDRSTGRQGQARVRDQVPRLPLGRRRRQARPRHGGGHQAPDAGWLTRWLKSPEKMVESDADAKAMLAEYKTSRCPTRTSRRRRSASSSDISGGPMPSRPALCRPSGAGH